MAINYEARMFMHKCAICRRRWNDSAKASACRRCGQMHIAQSSYLGRRKESAAIIAVAIIFLSAYSYFLLAFSVGSPLAGRSSSGGPLDDSCEKIADKNTTPIVISSNQHEQVPPQPARVFVVTAFCPCEKCCGKFADGITASGHKIQPGDKFCAADKTIPFGTLVDIPEYGRVPVLDRGGAIKGNRLDVYFESHEEAMRWGVKELLIVY